MNILKWKREENLCNCKHRWRKNMEKFMYLFEKINNNKNCHFFYILL